MYVEYNFLEGRYITGNAGKMASMNILYAYFLNQDIH